MWENETPQYGQLGGLPYGPGASAEQRLREGLEELNRLSLKETSGGQQQNKTPKKQGTPPSYTPPPKNLPGFPEAERTKPKGGRPRWKLPDGDIIEWDEQHREVERYNPRGKHKGVWSPDGREIKIPVPGRTIDPFVSPNGGFMEYMREATDLTGAALIVYIIVSEGSRLFPPRNLIPIP